MPNRPAIPIDIVREVLVESGHRCAVCGANSPLEKAHIIPWHKSKEHKAEDLICLCANCHARADYEKWGEETLRQYKRRPWVSRQYEHATPTLSTFPELRLAFLENGRAVDRVERTINKQQDCQAYNKEAAQLVAFKHQHLQRLADRGVGQPKEKVEVYLQSANEYLKELQFALAVKRSRLYGCRLNLELVLDNIGSTPAIGVEVDLRFPAISFVIDSISEDNDFTNLDFPVLPNADWGSVSYAWAPRFPITASPVLQYGIGRTYPYQGRNTVHLNYAKIRHHKDKHTENLVVYVPPEIEREFQVEYSIHADNLPTPASGELTVVLTLSSGN